MSLKLSLSSFLLILLIANLHCKKSAPPPNILPPMTQEGKNTFGSMVNGEVWIPYYQCGLINFLTKCEELQTTVTYSDTSSKFPFYFKLFTSRKIDGGSFTDFIIDARIMKTGNIDNSSFQVTFTRDSLSYSPQYPQGNASNVITLTKLDTVNQIISGTFYFTLYGPYGPGNGDSVVVTDGRFDVTYNACLCH